MHFFVTRGQDSTTPITVIADPNAAPGSVLRPSRSAVRPGKPAGSRGLFFRQAATSNSVTKTTSRSRADQRGGAGSATCRRSSAPRTASTWRTKTSAIHCAGNTSARLVQRDDLAHGRLQQPRPAGPGNGLYATHEATSRRSSPPAQQVRLGAEQGTEWHLIEDKLTSTISSGPATTSSRGRG